MSVEKGPLQAWLVLAFGDRRQYAGNMGYEDELTSTYRYDSNVANWRNVAAGDLLLLRDQKRLIGVSRVRRVESYPSTKSLQRCPVCGTTGIKERRQTKPRFRCKDGHEFEQPHADIVRCTRLEARFEGSFRSAEGVLTIEQLRRGCPKYTDQLSIQRANLADLAENLQQAVPGYETLITAPSPQADNVADSGQSSMARATAPPDGELGLPYRRPSEECSATERDPFAVDPAAVERANRGHARAQNLLADCVTNIGLTARSPARTEPDYDLGWEFEGCLWVAEVKSLTAANEEKQMRLGLGQILRYRHLLSRGGRNVTGVLMVERAPKDNSWPVLCQELGIVLLWPDMLDGLSAHLTLGSNRSRPAA